MCLLEQRRKHFVFARRCLRPTQTVEDAAATPIDVPHAGGPGVHEVALARRCELAPFRKRHSPRTVLDLGPSLRKELQDPWRRKLAVLGEAWVRRRFSQFNLTRSGNRKVKEIVNQVFTWVVGRLRWMGIRAC